MQNNTLKEYVRLNVKVKDRSTIKALFNIYDTSVNIQYCDYCTYSSAVRKYSNFSVLDVNKTYISVNSTEKKITIEITLTDNEKKLYD